MTALREDIQNILEAAALRLGEPPVLRDALVDVYRILEDEEEQAALMCDLVQELEQRLEDDHGPA
jgi:hypothetical protein